VARHFFPLTGRPPCKDCGAPEGVALNLSPTGYSVGSDYEHKPQCPALRCKHGLSWMVDCADCEAERRPAADCTCPYGGKTGTVNSCEVHGGDW
jgi:hypothetical protein